MAQQRRAAERAAGRRRRKNRRKEVKVLAWNTRTLRAAIVVRDREEMLEVVGCHAKLSYIRQFMTSHKSDYLCISEHHCADRPDDEAHGNGLLWRDIGMGYKFVYCQHVGMVMSPRGFKQFQLAGEKVVVHGAEGRVMSVEAVIKGAKFIIVSIYGPTYQRSDAEKERFWDCLTQACDINNNTTPIIMGDFNARPGTCENANGQEVVGRFGEAQNANGRMLCNFAGMNGYRVANSFFEKPACRRGTWWHPRSKRYYEIDLALVRAQDLSRVRNVRVSHGFDSDHRPIELTMRFTPGYEARDDQSKRVKLNKYTYAGIQYCRRGEGTERGDG